MLTWILLCIVISFEFAKNAAGQILYWEIIKIRVDNGPEFIAEVLNKWATDRNMELKFIEKDKPHQNGYMERFNRIFREEGLDAY